MYDKDADIRAGFHKSTSMVTFQVFRSSDHPELGLPNGWYWDLPKYRTYKFSIGYAGTIYFLAYGPFDTSMTAHDHAVVKTGTEPKRELRPVTVVATARQSATGSQH